MGATAAGAAAALATSHLGCWPWSSRSKHKNVILIISDSLRRDAVGFYDDPPPGAIPSEPDGKFEPAKMPNLVNFAKSAVRFNNGYVSSFPTVPARHDILTGTYTFLYKLWGPMDPKTLTLQKVLNSKDIHTALVSDVPHPFSWDGERPGAKEPPYKYQLGFKEWEHIRGQENDPYITGNVPIKFPCDHDKLRLPDTMVTQYLKNASIRNGEEKNWYSPQTFDWATQWLKKNSYNKQPFFLYVDTFDPHEPWDPPKHYVEQYDPGYKGQEVIAPRYEFWKQFLTPAELKHCQALYKGEASMVDAWFGQLMDTIIELGLLDNTLVLFITDHGVSLGERGIIGKGVIRGPTAEKNVSQCIPLLPEICRIPMLAHYPNCKAGSSVDGLAQPANIPATILEYFGIPFPDTDFKAPSLWPMITGLEPSPMKCVISSPTLSAYGVPRVPRPTDRPTITDGRWLLVYSCAGWGDELQKKPHDPSWKDKRRAYFTGELLTPQLYDLKNDPGCRVNLYPKEKDEAKKLHAYLCDFIRTPPSPMRHEHWGYFEHLENN